jgi:hypothetical protein
VEYFDQYDELQGLFTKRFNPYLNDVFGTNIEIKNIELGETINLNGDDVSFSSISVTVPKTEIEIIYSPESGLYTHKGDTIRWEGWMNSFPMTCSPPTTIICTPVVSGYD